MLVGTFIQRCALIAFAILVTGLLGVPHVHAISQHDAEICTGHLADHGADDPDHAGVCALCRVSQRTDEAMAPSEATPAVASSSCSQCIASNEAAPRSSDRSAATAPRAPPAFS